MNPEEFLNRKDQIRLSFAQVNHENSRSFQKFYRAIGDFERIGSVICKHPWSPIIFKNNYRKSDNFDMADLIALDFDSGEWTLKDAENFIIENNFTGIIGLTKSHGKQKGNALPCDRFRLIIKSTKTCFDRDSYEYTLSQLTKMTPSDKSCKDAARFYYPCSAIYQSFKGTNAMRWLDVPFEESKEAKESFALDIAERHWRSIPDIPPKIWGDIMWGCRPPGRHKMCYVLGAQLGLRGFSVDEILSLLTNNKSPLLQIGVEDVRRAVHNGRDRALLEIKQNPRFQRLYERKAQAQT